jgi:hypothetical protein
LFLLPDGRPRQRADGGATAATAFFPLPSERPSLRFSGAPSPPTAGAAPVEAVASGAVGTASAEAAAAAAAGATQRNSRRPRPPKPPRSSCCGCPAGGRVCGTLAALPLGPRPPSRSLSGGQAFASPEHPHLRCQGLRWQLWSEYDRARGVRQRRKWSAPSTRSVPAFKEE